jgi:hypothetical protein
VGKSVLMALVLLMLLMTDHLWHQTCGCLL